MNKLQHKIHKRVAVLSTGDKEYLKELTLTSWGSKQPRLDIRTWRVYPDGHQEPLRGIALSAGEVEILRDALNQLDLNTLGQEV